MPSNAEISSDRPRTATRHPARIKLVAIVGPTAVGKTALGVALAERFDGEIVGADSRQIYRFMDIGTAKPTIEERTRVPHHLIDLVAPDATLTVGEFKRLASNVISEVHARGKLPLLVGGTGLYVRTVLEGWTIPEVAPDYALRGALEREVQSRGKEHLYRRLQQVDPLAAQKVDPRNVRRVIRYLEVYHATGDPISTRQRKEAPAYDILRIGLTLPREQLYRNIDARVDEMMAGGFLGEVRELLARGYDERLPALSGLGYRQLIEHLHGRLSLDEAVYETKKATRRFVRRQYAWFPLEEPGIFWLNADAGAVTRAAEAIARFLEPAPDHE